MVLKVDKNRLKEWLWNSPVIIALGSFIWLVLRSGTKPSRIAYPCQQVAKKNVEIFGIPVLALFFHRLTRSRRYRRKVLWSTIGLGVALVAIVKMYQQISWWQINNQVNAQTTKPVVVRVKDSSATAGLSFGNNNWTTRANETVVAGMMDKGIMALTGQSSVAAAWNYLFTQRNSDGHAYRAGEKIAVKINFNNTLSSSAASNYNNPSVAVAKSLVRQLKLAGVAESAITFYDFSRQIPTGYSGAIKATYPGVNVTGSESSSCVEGLFPTSWVCLSGTLVDAAYLINSPLFRVHSGAGFTFSFKNHLGSVSGPGEFHNFFATSASTNSLVVLNSNSYIRNKTTLILGDALYVQTTNGPDAPPDYAYNALFFAKDSVAADAVMADYLQKETTYFAPFYDNADPRTYMRLAEAAGLGVQQTTCTTNTSNCSMAFTKISLINCEPNCSGVIVPTVTPTSIPVTIQPTATPTPNPSATPTIQPTITPVILRGDTDGDGDVDGVDYARWLIHFGEYITGMINGDFDGNGIVDGLDYAVWVINFTG